MKINKKKEKRITFLYMKINNNVRQLSHIYAILTTIK